MGHQLILALGQEADASTSSMLAVKRPWLQQQGVMKGDV